MPETFCSMLTPEPIPPCADPRKIRAGDLREIQLRQQNLINIRRLQKVMLIEEDRALSHDGVLARLLTFYARFVPLR